MGVPFSDGPPALWGSERIVKEGPCRDALRREPEPSLAHLYELFRKAGLIVCSMEHF